MDIAAGIGFKDLAAVAGQCSGLRVGARKKSVPARVVMELAPYRVASLRTRGPVTITGLSGRLWITVPGKLDDLILQAGERCELQGDLGGVLLSTAGARCPASFGIQASGPAADRHRLFGMKAPPHFQVEFA